MGVGPCNDGFYNRSASLGVVLIGLVVFDFVVLFRIGNAPPRKPADQAGIVQDRKHFPQEFAE